MISICAFGRSYKARPCLEQIVQDVSTGFKLNMRHYRHVTAMGDVRFVMIGIGLVFAGFVTFGVFGEDYQSGIIESGEFDTCYEYSDDTEPVSVRCEDLITGQISFFAIVIGFISAGAAALVKGAKGDWDSRVKPEEMVGPKSGEDSFAQRDPPGSSNGGAGDQSGSVDDGKDGESSDAGLHKDNGKK